MVAESAIVTGGASGIGLAVVKAFRQLGIKVVSLDREPSLAADYSVVGDVRDWNMHRQAVSVAIEAGPLKALVANAGMHDGGLKLDEDPNHFSAIAKEVLEINTLGYILAIQAAAQELIKARGNVVLTLSDAAFGSGHITAAGIAYTTSKHAGRGILAWAAKALAPHVRVNAVAPGGVVTNLSVPSKDQSPQRLPGEDSQRKARIQSRNPLGTVLDADEVAQMYTYLCSPECRGMTGQTLRLDGGLGL